MIYTLILLLPNGDVELVHENSYKKLMIYALILLLPNGDVELVCKNSCES